jgi:preprotein translocase subunit SecA
MTFKNKTKSQLKPFQQSLMNINRSRSYLEKLPDYELKNRSIILKDKARHGTDPDDLCDEAFALACEASRRVLNLNPFDEQVAAGIAMHRGNLVQMQTGEGKTLAAVLPAYLDALYGKGVHILTFNDYLAQRDAQWMGPVYLFLGLSCAFIREGMPIESRKKAYNSDITYITAKEAGFDFLRDQRSLSPQDLVLREFNYAIVDEADSILIDEARIPLVIAGETSPVQIDFYDLEKLVRGLDPGIDFYTDEYCRDVNFTDEGLDRMEKYLHCGDLHTPANNQLLSALNLALQSRVLLKRNIDYIVRDGKIELVDEFTGRIAENRRWPYGLQTALEAKEELEIQPEGTILGSITFQHFLNLYPKIAGMTATAKTSEQEFHDFYGLNVVEIPTHCPCIRIDMEDMVFTHKEAKNAALIKEIKDVHVAGRPILVGTASVEESEILANALHESGVDCRILNAKNDEAEAAVVAEAGALNAVTISTNMAGRGTDIRLGGKNQESREKVVALGGLYVIGTNRHESRRIDFQLRGRAGRQGDPGFSRFFISLEDDLMIRYKIDALLPQKYKKFKQDEPLHDKFAAREIARAQRIIEGENFEIRKTLRSYSFLVEEQRKIIGQKRMDIIFDFDPPNLLSLHMPEKYGHLQQMAGQKEAKEIEKRILLFHIDRYWTDYLSYITHIKEGIHLWSLAGKVPYFEFQKLAIGAFEDFWSRIEEQAIESFNDALIDENGIDMEKEGLTGPSSTWTYLVNDMPFKNPLQFVLLGSAAFGAWASLLFVLYFPITLIGTLIYKMVKKKK